MIPTPLEADFRQLAFISHRHFSIKVNSKWLSRSVGHCSGLIFDKMSIYPIPFRSLIQLMKISYPNGGKYVSPQGSIRVSSSRASQGKPTSHDDSSEHDQVCPCLLFDISSQSRARLILEHRTLLLNLPYEITVWRAAARKSKLMVEPAPYLDEVARSTTDLVNTGTVSCAVY